MRDNIDGDFFESFKKFDNVIYSDIDHIDRCFQGEGAKILITHNGDKCVDENLYSRFKQFGKFKYWFAQNINCKHNDLICLPIGFERIRWCSFNKYEIMKQCKELFKENPKKILYANFSINTNIYKRKECIMSFFGKEYLTNNTCNYVSNIKSLTIEQYKKYCNDILNHKFVLCPEGNGIDTHRFWETLYLGRIPVVLHNYVNDSFSDMPILILDKWEDFENHINDNISGSYDKLTRRYWYERILK